VSRPTHPKWQLGSAARSARAEPVATLGDGVGGQVWRSKKIYRPRIVNFFPGPPCGKHEFHIEDTEIGTHDWLWNKDRVSFYQNVLISGLTLFP